MAVVLVIDTYQIDTEQAVVAETGVPAMEQLRQKISQHLKNNNDSLLRVRFKSKALYERFKDFEGLEHVLPTQQLLPRTIFRDLADEILPEWLSNELIIQLNLLSNHNHADLSFSLIDRVIRACDNDLLSQDFLLFTEALKGQTPEFWLLLSVPEIKKRFLEHFRLAFDFSDELALLFFKKISKSKSIKDFFILLAYEQHQEILRKILAHYHFQVSLPPKSLSSLLLKLPLLNLLEQDAKELPSKCLKALDELARLVEKGSACAYDITDLIIAPWPTLLNKVADLADRNGQIVCAEIVAKLESFHSTQAKQLALLFNDKLNLHQLSPLPSDANTDEVVQWSECYFELIRQQFLTQQTVNEELNLSFSEWLIKQSARIARSDSDWRQCSKRVETYLQQGYLVIIFVIDALSALNQDLLFESAEHLDNLDLKSEVLFAPLPTLTEVGKMAIVTGLPTNQLPSDPDVAIRKRYQPYLPNENSLRVLKSWQPGSDHLDDNTSLVVYFENRIDERLHDCVDFERHRRDIVPILKQTMTKIDSWKKDAGYLNRDIVCFITADHGMTVVDSDYKGETFGEIKDRVFKIKSPIPDNAQDFIFIPRSADSGYLVPKDRRRLNGSAALTHGGLTPEEVLVPFVTLSSRLPEIIKMPLELSMLNNKCQRISDKSWQLSLELSASVNVKNIKVRLESPLIGIESISAISAGDSHKMLLVFSALSEQSGLTELTIHLGYDKDGAHELNTRQFSCIFPEPLLEKDAGTQGFEDMFN
jgi:hypothetical protein